MLPVRKSTERKFWKSLCKAFQKMIDKVRNGNGSFSHLKKETEEFVESPEMGGFLKRIISNMVKTERADSARSWREAASRSRNGRKMQQLIANEMQGPVGKRVNEIVAENAKFIKNVPKEWAEHITDYAYQEALKGKRVEEVEAEIRKTMPGMMENRLKLIARTECAKANAAIVQARAEMCGIKAYIWRSVNDERVRGAHSRMDGVLVFYNDPPNPEAVYPVRRGKGKPPKPYGNYHAGNTFNCRCYQEPVVDMSFLPDTIRVHDHGKVTSMTRAQIKRKYGNISG